jgi:hypothetical protein
MNKLTDSQIRAILNFAKHPLIKGTGVDVEDGKPRVRIKSVQGAKWNEVDAALHEALDEVFPDLSYAYPATKEYNPIEKAKSWYYFLKFEGETLINLIISGKPREG